MNIKKIFPLIIIASFVLCESYTPTRFQKMRHSFEVFQGHIKYNDERLNIKNIEYTYFISEYGEWAVGHKRWKTIVIMKIDDKYYRGGDISRHKVLNKIAAEIDCLESWELNKSITEEEVDKIMNPNLFRRFINMFRFF